jgi:hypothetical protein
VELSKIAMRWCRTIPVFVRVLIALFMLAQFSGVVSSPFASVQSIAAQSISDAAVSHHHHGHDHGGAGIPHNHGVSGGLADTCCALHAYFAGVLPPAIAIAIGRTIGEPLAASPDDFGLGIAPARLDRPPRPLRDL